MKKYIAPLLSVALLATAAVVGCVTSKTQTVTANPDGTFDTNIVTSVNEANLAIYTTTIRGATALSVSLVLDHNKNLVQPLKSAQVAIDGIVNGSNPQTIQQVLDMLKAQNDPILTREATDLLALANQLEQKLVAKFGSSVAGEVVVKLAQATSDGLTLGLAGH